MTTIDDIVAIAEANRVPVIKVARKKLEQAARSEAPQGVLALAAALPESLRQGAAARRPADQIGEIGRASCRERG